MKDLKYYTINYPVEDSTGYIDQSRKPTVTWNIDKIFVKNDISKLDRIIQNNFTNTIKSGAKFYRNDIKDFNSKIIKQYYSNLLVTKGISLSNTLTSYKANYRILNKNIINSLKDLVKPYVINDTTYQGSTGSIFQKIYLRKLLLTDELRAFLFENYDLYMNEPESIYLDQSEYVYVALNHNRVVIEKDTVTIDSDPLNSWTASYAIVYDIVASQYYLTDHIEQILLADKLPFDTHYIDIDLYSNFISNKRMMLRSDYDKLNNLLTNSSTKDLVCKLFFDYTTDGTGNCNTDNYYIALFYYHNGSEIKEYANKYKSSIVNNSNMITSLNAILSNNKAIFDFNVVGVTNKSATNNFISDIFSRELTNEILHDIFIKLCNTINKVIFNLTSLSNNTMIFNTHGSSFDIQTPKIMFTYSIVHKIIKNYKEQNSLVNSTTLLRATNFLDYIKNLPEREQVYGIYLNIEDDN